MVPDAAVARSSHPPSRHGSTKESDFGASAAAPPPAAPFVDEAPAPFHGQLAPLHSPRAMTGGVNAQTTAPAETIDADAAAVDPRWERDRQTLLRETELAAEAAANAATVAKEAADRAIGVRNTLIAARSRNPSAKSGGRKGDEILGVVYLQKFFRLLCNAKYV